jgi:type IV pilus assembly protein PilN
MIRINLLPHREIRRKQQQKEFFALLGAVIGLGAAAWFAVHSYLGGQLEEQDGRNSYLESEIAVLDKQIDEIKKLKEQTSALLQRKKIVEYDLKHHPRRRHHPNKPWVFLRQEEATMLF